MMRRIYAKNVWVWIDVHVCWCRCFTYVLVQMDTCPVSFQVLDFTVEPFLVLFISVCFYNLHLQNPEGTLYMT